MNSCRILLKYIQTSIAYRIYSGLHNCFQLSVANNIQLGTVERSGEAWHFLYYSPPSKTTTSGKLCVYNMGPIRRICTWPPVIWSWRKFFSICVGQGQSMLDCSEYFNLFSNCFCSEQALFLCVQQCAALHLIYVWLVLNVLTRHIEDCVSLRTPGDLWKWPLWMFWELHW